MSEITLRELGIKRDELKATILNAVKQFEDETGVHLTDIDIERVKNRTMGSQSPPESILVDVHLGVRML